jgi:hypothetical protein
LTPGDGGQPDPVAGYSSLIGICTAIGGNILISIALNTQRYAHIKLNEQWAERRRLLRRAERRRRTAPPTTTYGTESTTSIKERNRNGNGHSTSAPFADADESEPLMASYRQDEERDDDDVDGVLDVGEPHEPGQKSYLKSPYWWTGIVLMTIGECGNFLAYGFAPASIVSPLGVVAIISNCIIAPLVMKEQFRWRDFYGVVTAVAGAVTIVVSAKENNPKLGPHEIWALIGTWEFETYLGITVLLMTVLMLASNKYGGKSIFVDLGLVGLFGGYTALSTKGVASLLSYTLLQTLTFPVTYLLLAILVFTAVMQIKYVNRSLQRFEATQVIPTQFVLFTLCVIVGSAVLYRDFERYPGDDAGKFVGGCALTFAGVWLITSGRPEPRDDDEDYDEDDEAIILRAGDYPAEAVASSQSTLGAASPPESVAASTVLSQVSLPATLEQNHWDSQRHSLVSIPSDSPSPVDDNPWHDRLYTTAPSTSAPRSRASLYRLLGNPLASLTSLLSTAPDPNRSAEDIPPPTPRTPRTASSRASSARASQTLPSSSLPHVHTLADAAAARHSTPQTRPPSNSLSGGSGQHHGGSQPPLFPGPFPSPLSSSLSALVAADSVRRSRRASRPPRLASLAGLTPLQTPQQQQQQTGTGAPTSAPSASAPSAVLPSPADGLQGSVTAESAAAETPETPARRATDGGTGGVRDRRQRRGDDDDDDDGAEDREGQEADGTPSGRRASLGQRVGALVRGARDRLVGGSRSGEDAEAGASSSPWHRRRRRRRGSNGGGDAGGDDDAV